MDLGYGMEGKTERRAANINTGNHVAPGFQPPLPTMRSSRNNHLPDQYQNNNQYDESSKQAGMVSNNLSESWNMMKFAPSRTDSFDLYIREDDTRFPQEANSLRANENSPNLQYDRDGPSPGRSYKSGKTDEVVDGLQNLSPRNEADFSGILNKSPFRPINKSETRKRKANEGAPILISNQSSDDSLQAFISAKKPRSGNSSNDPATLIMKSFTPLSPSFSRTFSRDDPLDMSKFVMPKFPTGDGFRALHSWSSGNSNEDQVKHSPSDVRNCFVDWNSSSNGFSGGGGNSAIQVAEAKSSQQQSPNRPHSEAPRSNNEGRTMDTGRSYGWHPPHSEDTMNPFAFDPYERNPYEKRITHPAAPIPQSHPTHQVENQYARHPAVGQPEIPYSRNSYWGGPNNNPTPLQHRPQRRDDLEASNIPNQNPQMIRHSSPQRSNHWSGHYNDYPRQMYDRPVHRGGPPRGRYDSWGVSRNHPYSDIPYGRGSVMQPGSMQRPYVNKVISENKNLLQGAKMGEGPNGLRGMIAADGTILLAMPDDRISLSETLCVVRENVEVFVANDMDVRAPAPGRKRPVLEGQVGLRCIHCRHATHQSDKVKRAVCFPSSIKRIYRTVIDMKLDHFKACKFVPYDLKCKLEELKQSNARSTGTTMQYFVSAAMKMGMIDGGNGIRIKHEEKAGVCSNDSIPSSKPEEFSTLSPTVGTSNGSISTLNSPAKSLSTKSPTALMPSPHNSITRTDLSIDLSFGLNVGERPAFREESYFSGKRTLSLPEDKTSLSPLRCFLRENVYAFSATAEDIAVRTPTTFSVTLGQVGICCVHCYNMPAKERSNRAVCFPFAIARIYQSVADIQRFHLGECKRVPEDVKARFLELQSASSKGSKGLATRQYWMSSAKKLGLVDTEGGIRFARDPSLEIQKAESLDILAQVASDVTSASKPLVTPEDKPHIAKFLYVVMKQLQPCKFTEADRNKRRLKDVGCIGVECKHCAGQVDGRKFFWSSVNAVESNFVSVHTHMMDCRLAPEKLKAKLANLKATRKEETARLKSGSQKAFFARVWSRLHEDLSKVPCATKSPNSQNTSISSNIGTPSSATMMLHPSQALTEGDQIIMKGGESFQIQKIPTLPIFDERASSHPKIPSSITHIHDSLQHESNHSDGFSMSNGSFLKMPSSNQHVHVSMQHESDNSDGSSMGKGSSSKDKQADSQLSPFGSSQKPSDSNVSAFESFHAQQLNSEFSQIHRPSIAFTFTGISIENMNTNDLTYDMGCGEPANDDAERNTSA
jgi:hypothetical protein